MYLEVDDLSIYDNLLLHEISTNSCLVGLHELLVDVRVEQRRLADTGYDDNYAESPRMITFDSFFLLMVDYCSI